MQSCKQLKTFFQFSSPFLKYALNFQNFEKKDDFHSLCISEITDCQRDR